MSCDTFDSIFFRQVRFSYSNIGIRHDQFTGKKTRREKHLTQRKEKQLKSRFSINNIVGFVLVLDMHNV